MNQIDPPSPMEVELSIMEIIEDESFEGCENGQSTMTSVAASKVAVRELRAIETLSIAAGLDRFVTIAKSFCLGVELGIRIQRNRSIGEGPK